MTQVLSVALSAQLALQEKLATVSRNVANVNTAGYRADEVKFEQHLALLAEDSVAFASAGRPFVSTRPGAVKRTDNPLDVAVHGEGWFAVQGPDGGRIYTRDGRFQLDENGQLRTVTGLAVLDAGGGPITLEAGGAAPQIAHDGGIIQGQQRIGAIGLFRLPPEAVLTRAGHSGVTSSQEGVAVADFTANGIKQGFVEGANVDPVREMTQMMMISRAFEAVAGIVDAMEQRLSQSVKTLGDVG